MAFPANKQSASFEGAWYRFCEIAIDRKRGALVLSNASSTGTTRRQNYLKLRQGLDSALTEWAQIIADYPGLQAWVRENVAGLGAIALAGEYVAMRDAAIALRDWINNSVPIDAETGAAVIIEPDGTHFTFPSTGFIEGASGPTIEEFRTHVATFAATIETD